MANPSLGNNLHGVLVAASSGSTTTGTVNGSYNELNIPIGTSIANGSSVTSDNISLPSTKSTVICLVQLSSGTATCTLDSTSDGTTPTFASSNKSQFQVTRGEPIFLSLTTANPTQTNTNGVITTTAVQNVVALKIQCQAGSALTVQKLRLVSAKVFGDLTAWNDDRTTFLPHAAPDSASVDNTGYFKLDT